MTGSGAGGREFGVALVGHGFMGRAHALGWSRVTEAFPELRLRPRVVALVGRDPARTKAAAARLGVPESTTDFDAVLARPDVDLIDVCTPGDTHALYSRAALAAGKHVLCEKPLANSLAEADAMAAAAAEAGRSGVVAMVGFNYRRVPALALARRLVDEGRLGTLRHLRFAYLQDWLVDPTFPATWRLTKGTAGSGALGDLGAHLVDLALFLTGELPDAVSGVTRTFVPARPPAAAGVGIVRDERAGELAATVPVTVDDAVAVLAHFPSGALGTFEATRMATGRKNGLAVELYGSQGALSFDLERLNELTVVSDSGGDAGAARRLVTEPADPYMAAWWPPGHTIGWEHTFVHEFADLLAAIDAGEQPTPSFADGRAVQAVLEAIGRSAETGSVATVDGSPPGGPAPAAS